MDNSDIYTHFQHSYFDKEQKKGVEAKGKFHPDNMPYDPDMDCFYCPSGKEIVFTEVSEQSTASGYERTLSKYQTIDCTGCLLKTQCHKGKGNRVIEVSHLLRTMRMQATDRLLTEEGLEHRKRRSIETEGTFGIIKVNHHFRRFLTKGIENVEIEFGLLTLAQNLRKLIKAIPNILTLLN
ncbi:MAG: transposase [Bacteroidales bacterium]|nr:transposase [Bacteroidales bacterium]